MAKLPLKGRIARELKYASKWEGYCYRNVPLQFATPEGFISTQRTRERGGRYNFKGMFDALYLSCDPTTCLEESTRCSQTFGIDLAKRFPRAIKAFQVDLSKVLDLTNYPVRRRTGISRTTLIMTNWEEIQEKYNKQAITQKIGRLARDLGFEGLLVPSAVCKGKNLVVFTSNVFPPSSYIAID